MRFRSLAGASTVALALATALACAGRSRAGAVQPVPVLALPPAADAPFELAEADDLARVRARFDALEVGDGERADLRAELAAEYARRIDHGLAIGRRFAAMESLGRLAELWTPEEIAQPASAAPRATLALFKPQVERLRKSYARSGGDAETTLALLLLMKMDPGRAPAHAAEIDEIFVYADDLAVARFGQGSQRARPIEILESAVSSFPSADALDRLTRLYIDRQQAVNSLLRRNTSDFGLFRAHGGVLRTSWHLVRVHALANRLDDAPKALAEVTGVGEIPEVRRALTWALRPQATAAAWVALADVFRDRNPSQRDTKAALAVAREATRRFPESSTAFASAAEVAKEMDRIPQAIALYERAFALAADNRDIAEQLAELYEVRVSELAFNSRPRAARKRLEALEQFHTLAAKSWPGEPLHYDLADAYASMGRGLVSIGNLEAAQGYLKQSLELRPTRVALEYLGTIDLKQDRFDEAAGNFDRALMLPGDTLADEFARAKILRLASRAYHGAKKEQKALRYVEAALVAWKKIGKRGSFTRPQFNAERFIETGKLLWEIGKRDEALRAFDRAVDTDPDGASTHAAVVAFLVVRDQHDRALDTFHRALGNEEIGDYFKVYMSLWILSEARRGSISPDHLATEFLAARKGGLWYDELARFASGRSRVEELQKRANTPARRAELLYYLAMLSKDMEPQRTRELLNGVLETNMVLFFEYDMAKQWLKRGIAGRRNASASPSTR